MKRDLLLNSEEKPGDLYLKKIKIIYIICSSLFDVLEDKMIYCLINLYIFSVTPLKINHK